MNHEEALNLVTPFYDALTLPSTKEVADLVRGATTEGWRSFAGEHASKGREEFIQQVVGFGRLIPDLTWQIREVLVDGDRMVVRSTASGTPAGEFMGVPHRGARFSVTTIDIHTVVEGRLAVAWHVEDWMSAVRQLAAG